MLKGELELQIPTYYIDEYENIYSKTKVSTMENTFNKCLDYLCTTDGLDTKDTRLYVEKKLVLEFQNIFLQDTLI